MSINLKMVSFFQLVLIATMAVSLNCEEAFCRPPASNEVPTLPAPEGVVVQEPRIIALSDFGLVPVGVVDLLPETSGKPEGSTATGVDIRVVTPVAGTSTGPESIVAAAPAKITVLGGSSVCQFQPDHPACPPAAVTAGVLAAALATENGTLLNETLPTTMPNITLWWQALADGFARTQEWMNDTIVTQYHMVLSYVPKDNTQRVVYIVILVVLAERIWLFTRVSVSHASNAVCWAYAYARPYLQVCVSLLLTLGGLSLAAARSIALVVVLPFRICWDMAYRLCVYAVYYNRPKPVRVEDGDPAQDPATFEIDARMTKAVVEVENAQCYFTTDVTVGNVVYKVKYPFLAGPAPLPNEQEGLIPESITSSGRIKLLAGGKVPQCAVVFFDTEDQKIIGNGARVTIPKHMSPEPVIITAKHVAHDVEALLKAGHHVVMRKLRETKSVQVTLEAVPQFTTVRMDLAEYGMNIDIARIPCPPGVAASLAIGAAPLAKRAVRNPEFYYQIGNDVYLTTPNKTATTKNPFIIAHSASTVPGASGCIGFRVRGSSYSAAFMHFAGDETKPVNYATNLVELYNRVQLPPRAESFNVDEDYEDANKGHNSQVDEDFDPRNIASLHYDYNGDEAMAVDSDGHVSWVKGVRHEGGKVIFEFEDEHGDSHTRSWDDADDFDNYFPLGVEDQADFDPKAAHEFMARQLNRDPNLYQKTKKGPHYVYEAMSKETEHQVATLQQQLAVQGKQLASIDAAASLQRRTEAETRDSLTNQLREIKAQLMFVLQTAADNKQQSADAKARIAEERMATKEKLAKIRAQVAADEAEEEAERQAEIARISSLELHKTAEEAPGLEPAVASPEKLAAQTPPADIARPGLELAAPSGALTLPDDDAGLTRGKLLPTLQHPPTTTEIRLESGKGVHHKSVGAARVGTPATGRANNAPGGGQANLHRRCVSLTPTPQVPYETKAHNLSTFKEDQKRARAQKAEERKQKTAHAPAPRPESRDLDGATTLSVPVPVSQDFQAASPSTHRSRMCDKSGGTADLTSPKAASSQ